MGVVSLWDARPACRTDEEPRGRILPMENGVDGDKEAIQRVRFKVSPSNGKRFVPDVLQKKDAPTCFARQTTIIGWIIR